MDKPHLFTQNVPKKSRMQLICETMWIMWQTFAWNKKCSLLWCNAYLHFVLSLKRAHGGILVVVYVKFYWKNWQEWNNTGWKITEKEKDIRQSQWKSCPCILLHSYNWWQGFQFEVSLPTNPPVFQASLKFSLFQC